MLRRKTTMPSALATRAFSCCSVNLSLALCVPPCSNLTNSTIASISVPTNLFSGFEFILRQIYESRHILVGRFLWRNWSSVPCVIQGKTSLSGAIYRFNIEILFFPGSKMENQAHSKLLEEITETTIKHTKKVIVDISVVLGPIPFSLWSWNRASIDGCHYSFLPPERTITYTLRQSETTKNMRAI